MTSGRRGPAALRPASCSLSKVRRSSTRGLWPGCMRCLRSSSFEIHVFFASGRAAKSVCCFLLPAVTRVVAGGVALRVFLSALRGVAPGGTATGTAATSVGSAGVPWVAVIRLSTMAGRVLSGCKPMVMRISSTTAVSDVAWSIRKNSLSACTFAWSERVVIPRHFSRQPSSSAIETRENFDKALCN